MDHLAEIIFKYKEFLNVGLGLIIGLIPALFDVIIKKGKKRKLSLSGYNLMFICVIFISLNAFSFIRQEKILNYERKRLTQGDILFKLNFRYSNPRADYDEMCEKIPREIISNNIEFDKAVTSGIFRFQNAHSGKGRSTDSKFVTYICNISDYKSIENFPTTIDSISPKDVILHIDLDTVTKFGFTLDGSIKLIIRNVEYYGEQYLNNKSYIFK